MSKEIEQFHIFSYFFATYELQSSGEFPQSKPQLMKEVKM